MSLGPIARAAGVASIAMLMNLTSACYIDPSQHQDRVKTRGGEDPEAKPLNDDPSLCQTTFAKGCFDGQVQAKKEFTIDGHQFFDATDLSSRFKELLNVDAKDYELKLTTAIDNDSFLQGFEYLLTGAAARSGRVRPNGTFALDELAEGNYDLRVKRSVKFTISAQVTHTATDTTPTTAPAQLVTETVVKTKCATIYADTSISIRRGLRQALPFEQFQLKIYDGDCASTQSDGSISFDR